MATCKYFFHFLDKNFDTLIILIMVSIYFYLAFRKSSKAMLIYVILTAIWGTALFWVFLILPPSLTHLFGDDSRIHGYMLTLGGMLFGLPLFVLSLITWGIKKIIEKRK